MRHVPCDKCKGKMRVWNHRTDHPEAFCPECEKEVFEDHMQQTYQTMMLTSKRINGDEFKIFGASRTKSVIEKMADLRKIVGHSQEEQFRRAMVMVPAMQKAGSVVVEASKLIVREVVEKMYLGTVTDIKFGGFPVFQPMSETELAEHREQIEKYSSGLQHTLISDAANYIKVVGVEVRHDGKIVGTAMLTQEQVNAIGAWEEEGRKIGHRGLTADFKFEPVSQEDVQPDIVVEDKA